MYCLDCCVKYISENAFIHVALNGTSFCESAASAFWIQVRNPGLFLATNMVGWIIQFIGKGLITAFTGMITILVINFTMPFVQQPFISAYCVMLSAYIISGFFLSCFDYSALSILQAFMVS